MTTADPHPQANSGASSVVGRRDVPLLDMTIGAALDAAVARHGSRDALIVRHQQIRWSWTELREQVDRVAAQLLALGLTPGDRVGIWSPNSVEWVLAQFATARAGLILVSLNPAYRLHEIEYALNKVGCRALILAHAFKSSDYTGMMATLAPELKRCAPGALQAARLPALRAVICTGQPPPPPGVIAFHELQLAPDDAARRRLAEASAAVEPRDAINIQFTSGTTGSPKGATLSHRNILNNGYFVARAMRFSERDRLCIPVPLYHCFGMVMGNLACMTHGACMVFPSEGFDPLATLQTVQDERCTALHGVPTMFIAELDHPRFAEFDLSSLRTGIMAGAPCPIEVMSKVIEQMHLPEITIAYGMTETSPVSFQGAVDDPIERRVSTVGRIQPHLEAKVVDSGATVPRGKKGELLVRGYSVMRGYWDDEARTHEAIDDDGWMHTGDLAVIDDDGYCSIVGRAKDMVIRGGENIYPREIEEFLYGHPAIRDVQVVGVPDARFGEELCACITLRADARLDAEAVRAFCRDQIAQYKIPRHVIFLEVFPMTVTGKIQKFLLRQAAREQLGLDESGSTDGNRHRSDSTGANR
ncbi:AMP-binding protein [Solimonas marina]|uniref:AMP-binding protein n=1 Tax=Solimonas marina TaxID=2714601 RepID=A0A969W6J1_9GAMM|nr:AMP-binding protein [Solimonas marina]NKF20863.1 AMP-binding protein [Solimonas marina]